MKFIHLCIRSSFSYKGFVLCVMLLLSVLSTHAANRYSVASNDWNNTATWSATSGGASGVSFPVAGDVVIIESGYDVKLTSAGGACADLTIKGVGSSLYFQLDIWGATFTVSGTLSLEDGGAVNDGGEWDWYTMSFNNVNIGTVSSSNNTTFSLPSQTNNGGKVNISGTLTCGGAGTGIGMFSIANAQSCGSNCSAPQYSIANIVLNDKGDLNLNVANGVTVSGNITNNSSQTPAFCSSGTLSLTGASKTIDGTTNIPIASNLTVSGSYQVLCGVTITVSGVTTNSGTITGASGAGASWSRIVDTDVTNTSGTIGSGSTYIAFSGTITGGTVNGSGTNVLTSSAQAAVCVVGTNYYSKSTGNLDVLTNWGTNTDGTGTAPSDFTSNNCTYNIRNNATPTIGASWTVSGTSSKVITGDATAACNFTIPSGFALSGTIDVSNNATLTIGNATIPTLGALDAGSTVEYSLAGSQTITAATYRNLIISGAGTKTLAAATQVSAALTVKVASTLALSTFTLGNATPPTSLVMESGSTGAAITGSGVLTLGGNVTVNSAGGASGATIAAPVALGAHRTFTVADDGSSAVDLSISSIVSGAFNVIKAGAGTMVLSGANTFSGTTTINAGVVNAQHAAALGTVGNGTTVASGAALQLQGGITIGAEALSLSGTGISTDGALRNISGANIYQGTVTLAAAATIQSDAGSLTFNTVANSITATNQNLTLQGAEGGTISGTITIGSGTLTKAGAGTWTLTGANTYTGATAINAGVLNIRHATAMGTTAGGATVASGAALQIQGDITVGAEALSIGGTGIAADGALRNISGTNTYQGTVTLTSASSIASDAGNLALTAANSITATNQNLTLQGAVGGTISGTITTGSGTLTKAGAGTWTLSGANTYTGATTVSVGVLNIQHATAMGTTAGGATVTSGAALQIQGGITVGAEALSIGGTGISSDGALRNISGTNTYQGTVTLTSASSIASDAGSLALTAANSITATNQNLTLQGAAGGTISGTITTGSGTLTKAGAGTWILGGANTYTGVTTITAGTLTLGASGVLADAGTITLNGGTLSTGTTSGYTETVSTLDLNANSAIALGTGNHTLTFANSSGVTWAGSTLTISGWTGIGGASGTAGKVFFGGAAGTLTGAQLAKITFTGYTGAFLLPTGELVPDPPTSYYSKSTGNLEVLANWGTNTDGTGAAPANFTSDNCYYNIRNNATPTIGAAWTVAGTGSKVIVGDGSAACNFTIPAGFALTTTSPVVIDVSNAATLTIGNASIPTLGTLDAGSTVEYSRAGAQTVTGMTYDNLILSGAGTKTLGANTNVSAALTVKVTSTLALSTFTLGASTPPTSLVMESGSTGAAITGSGALTMGGNVTVNYAGSGSSGATIAPPITLGANRTFTVADDGSSAVDLSISGVVSGAFNVIKAGVGTMNVSASNTYSGTTTISAGTLQLGAAGGGTNTPLGTTGGATSITSGAVLDLNGFTLGTAEALTINGTGISGSGAVMNSGAAATYSGLITLGSASSIVGGTGTIAVSNAGTITGATFGLTLGGAQGGTLSSILGTTSGILTKEGAGTWTLSGTNTYTGITTVSAGTLKLNNTAALGTNAAGTSVTSGAVLDLNGITLGSAEALTLNGTGIASGGALINSGAAATYSGAITLGSASSVSTTGNITASGVISGAFSLTKIGAASLIISGANTYSGGTTITAGTIQLAAAGVLADAGAITLNGGTLSTGSAAGFSETVGVLTVTANSIISLGTGSHSLSFANSSGASWTGGATLTINNWTGVKGVTGTAGKVFFGATTGTLTAGQLAVVTITNYSGTPFFLGTGELVPFSSCPSATCTYTVSGASGDQTVTAGQTYCIDADGFAGTITLNGGTVQVYDSRTLAAARVTFTAGNLNVCGTITSTWTVGTSDVINNYADNTVPTIQLQSGGIFNNYGSPGTVTFGDGYLNNTGWTVNNQAGGVMNISNTGNMGGTITNSGTLTYTAGMTMVSTGTFTNNAGATFTMTGGQLRTDGGAINNSGTITVGDLYLNSTNGIVMYDDAVMRVTTGISNVGAASPFSFSGSGCAYLNLDGATISNFNQVLTSVNTGEIAYCGPTTTITTGSSYTVNGATNATPIVITTSAAHSFVTGQRVIVSGVGGNTAANTQATITKISSTSFSMDGVAGNGNFTTNGSAVGTRLGTAQYLGATGCSVPENCLVPLPINLLSFNASAKKELVEIIWTSASEINNDYYTVERSSDAIDFEAIGVMKGAGNSTTANSYQLNDYKPLPGTSYYRLKQTDYNGQFERFNMVAVKFKSNEAKWLIHPNPSNGNELYITFVSKSDQDEDVTVAIYDVVGKLVYGKLIKSSFDKPISLINSNEPLSSGLYMVKVSSRNMVKCEKLVIE